MRTFDSEALRTASGDVFGRIYEYFLAGFSKERAHDDGEFFTRLRSSRPSSTSSSPTTASSSTLPVARAACSCNRATSSRMRARTR